jgi:hypothetical protein
VDSRQGADEKVHETGFIRNADNIEVDVARDMEPITIEMEKGSRSAGSCKTPMESRSPTVASRQ